MVKNVKIDDETHRAMSIKAATLKAQKNKLSSILIRVALAKFTDAEIQQFLSSYADSIEDEN